MHARTRSQGKGTKGKAGLVKWERFSKLEQTELTWRTRTGRWLQAGCSTSSRSLVRKPSSTNRLKAGHCRLALFLVYFIFLPTDIIMQADVVSYRWVCTCFLLLLFKAKLSPKRGTGGIEILGVWGGGVGWGGVGGRVRGGGIYCHHRRHCTLRRAAMRAISKSHNCEDRGKVTKDHKFWRERWAEANSKRGPSAYQPNALPLGHTGSLSVRQTASSRGLNYESGLKR